MAKLPKEISDFMEARGVLASEVWEVREKAKSNRVRNRHLGIARKPTKFRGWRKMNGTLVFASDRQK